MSLQQVRVELDSHVRRVDAPNGTALLGGSPFRLIRLSRSGASALDALLEFDDPISAESRCESDDSLWASAVQLQNRLIKAGMLHPIGAREDQPPSFAIVVPVYDDVIGLRSLLTAIRKIDQSASIAVVDDASPDSAALAAVVDEFKGTLIRHRTNSGPAAARNTGWRHVVASAVKTMTDPPEVVVFLDSDVVPDPHALSILLAHFADPSVVAAAPRVLAESGDGVVAAYEAANSALDLGPDASLVMPGTRLTYVPSAALAVRLADLEDANGFADHMRVGEDVDLIWRLTDASNIVRYDPASTVRHRNRTSWRAFAQQRFAYGTSAAELAERHGAKVAPLQLRAPVAASLAVMLFGGWRLRALGVGGALSIAETLRRKLVDQVSSPVSESLRLTAMTYGYGVATSAAATTRSWAPLMLLTRRGRQAWLAALVLPALKHWWKDRPALDPVRHVAVRCLDHGAYCAGVWTGVLRRRSITALLPDVRMQSNNDAS